MPSMRWRALGAVTLLAVAACAKAGALDQRPAELIVLDGATSVRDATRNGVYELTYQLESTYPAANVTSKIEAIFNDTRWSALAEDWLNPGNPSGHSLGWGSLLDSSKTPNTIVHKWSAEWKDTNDNIVIYMLRFGSAVPRDEPFLQRPDNHILKVTAAFVPANVVHVLRSDSDQPLR